MGMDFSFGNIENGCRGGHMGTGVGGSGLYLQDRSVQSVPYTVKGSHPHVMLDTMYSV